MYCSKRPINQHSAKEIQFASLPLILRLIVCTVGSFLFLPVIGFFLGTVNDLAVLAVMHRIRTMFFAIVRKSFIFERIGFTMLLCRLPCQTLIFWRRVILVVSSQFVASECFLGFRASADFYELVRSGGLGIKTLIRH